MSTSKPRATSSVRKRRKSALQSLGERLLASDPCCVVCGKRLTIAQGQQVNIVENFGVLACEAHAPVAGAGVTLARRAFSFIQSKVIPYVRR